jgi:hypothetical protein
VVCVVQSRQVRSVQEQARLTEEARRVEADARETQAARVKELERTQARLEKQVQDFTTVTTTLRSNETKQASAITAMAQRANKTPGATGDDKGGSGLGKGMGEMISKMMKDPAMRDVVRKQQEAVIGMMYSGLVKDLNLTPEEKAKFNAIMTDAQMKNVENASALMGDKKDEQTTSAAQKSITDAKKQADDEIKALLGDERFGQYQEYQKTMTERMQIDQLKNSLATQNMPMSDQQSAQLFQIMKEEKAAVPPVIPNDANQNAQAMKAMMSPETLEKQSQWMDDYNKRLLARAGQVLSQEQLKQYSDYLEQQASLQKLGMKMAREMFGGSKDGAAPAPSEK